MNILRQFPVMLAISATLILVFCSCSNGKSPTVPSVNPDIPDISDTASNTRSVLAIYDAAIDPVAKTFTVSPTQRTADYHIPLSKFYPNVLKITGYGWTPNFWADIKLNHPFPGSGIDAFDPRVIAILPANTGVSCFYPIFNVRANNKALMEPDGYVTLWDSLGGGFPGNANPFKAYFKDQPNRRWSSTGATSETQRWNIDLSGFGGPIVYKLVVDVSTNYPNPPTPTADNAPEPVQIATSIDDGLDSTGGSARVEVTFLDWQGASNIKCKVESPALFSSAIQLTYNRPGQNPDEYIFSGTISNDLLAPNGDYKVLIAAWDIPTDVHIFKEAIANVGISFNLSDVTPPRLNFGGSGFFISGDFLYALSDYNGIDIFNISDPLSPHWIGEMPFSGSFGDFFIKDNLAYITSIKKIYMFDINPPESAHLVYTYQSTSTITAFSSIFVEDGYAYVEAIRTTTPALKIIDIDPPDSAFEVKSVDIPRDINSIFISNGYAYIGEQNSDEGLQIVDIDPPESAHIVKTVTTNEWGESIYVEGDYAYIAAFFEGLEIVNINPPESAYIVKTVDTGAAVGVSVSNGYAYIADYDYGVKIIDVDPPESSSIVGSIPTFGYAEEVTYSHGYAYVADSESGIFVIDVEPPSSPHIENIMSSLTDAHDIDVENGMAYVTNGYSGIGLIDIDPPESATVIKQLDTYLASDVRISDDYAYVTDTRQGLLIIDINPPDSAHIVKSIDTPGSASDVEIFNGYAFVADGTKGLQIIDIDPVQESHIVNNVPMPDYALGSHIFNDIYCIVADYNQGIQIVDIDPIESASIIKAVPTSVEASNLDIYNGYAFVSGSGTLMPIVDIDPPEDAHLINSVVMSSLVYDVKVVNGYAFVANAFSGLKILDIDPIESPSIIASINVPYGAMNVDIVGNMAYVSCYFAGLHIIKLW